MSDKINQVSILNGRGLVQPKPSRIPDSFRITNLDLQDSRPSGGPINDPISHFVHKFTPNNTYADFIKKYR